MTRFNTGAAPRSARLGRLTRSMLPLILLGCAGQGRAAHAQDKPPQEQSTQEVWQSQMSQSESAQGQNEPNAPTPGIPESRPAAPPASPKAAEAVSDAVRATLAKYGSFIDHPTFGEVWVPTTTPQDWRPYAACHWVNSRKYGWFYDDRTAWGAIVHHYGRWTHDASMGWIWSPGADFSPGWVVWRTSQTYVGWAPLPPDAALKASGADAFNSGGFWTFMETARFDQGCSDTAIAPAARTANLLQGTQPVTDVVFAGGLWVAVLPAMVVGPIVDIDVTFKPWHVSIAAMLVKWNAIWNGWDVKTTVNFVDCDKDKPRRHAGNPPDVVPPPPIIAVPPTLTRRPPPGRTSPPAIIAAVPPPNTQPPVPVGNDRCLGLGGTAFRRCLTQGPARLATLPPQTEPAAPGPLLTPPARPIVVANEPARPQRPAAFRPPRPALAAADPLVRRPAIRLPPVHRPAPRRPTGRAPAPHRPVFQHPVRPRPARPAFRPRPVFHGRPVVHVRPVSHARPIFHVRPVFHARPVIHVRPAFHPAARPRPQIRSRPAVRRPMVRPAPRGGGRRRR